MSYVAHDESAHAPPAEVEEVELYHPKTFVGKYIWSQDAKIIAIQYSITALAVGLTVLYTGESTVSGFDAPLAGAMAFLGHLYPVFHGFKGGKGVATAAGVLLALNPWLGLGTLATFGIIVAFFRMISLASVISAVFAALWAWLLFGFTPITPVVAAIALLLVWRHRENIARIVRGAEPRLGENKT